MTKILKEPLLHFLILGSVIFAVYEWGAAGRAADVSQIQEIVITEGRIYSILQKFEKVWMRPPTEQELDGLIEGHIREEILYREALAMGLDRDDVIVRRRMRLKIEFLSEDLASLDKPTEDVLRAFLAAHPEKFRTGARFSFRQVYLNANDRGPSAEGDALALLARLRKQDSDAANAGDRFMIEQSFTDEPESEIERALGSQFVKSLLNTPQGSWQGPIVSGFGLHLVHISERLDGKLPELPEIRDIVIREWTAVVRKETNEAFYQSLRKGYKITVEKLEAPPSPELSLTDAEK